MAIRFETFANNFYEYLAQSRTKTVFPIFFDFFLEFDNLRYKLMPYHYVVYNAQIGS